MLLLLKRLFYSIDIFGKELKFEEDQSQNFKTSVGSVFTIIVFALFITFTFIIGKEIYQREYPDVLIIKEILDNQVVELTDFPIMIFIKDLEGKSSEKFIENINITITFTDISLENVVTEEEMHSLKSCNESDYPIHKDKLSQILKSANQNNEIPYCINTSKDSKIKNQLDQINSSSLSLKFEMCNKIENSNCPVTNLLVVIKLFNSFVVPKNYTTPMNYFQDYYVGRLDSGMGYETYISLSYQELISDNGWILSESVNSKSISVHSIKEEHFPSSEVSFLNFYFDITRYHEITYRKYMKIQELFAKLGGLYNFLTILIYVILYDYTLFKYRVKYLKCSLEIEEKIQLSKGLNPEINNNKLVNKFNLDEYNNQIFNNLKIKPNEGEELFSKSVITLVKNNENLNLNNFNAKNADEIHLQSNINSKKIENSFSEIKKFDDQIFNLNKNLHAKNVNPSNKQLFEKDITDLKILKFHKKEIIKEDPQAINNSNQNEFVNNSNFSSNLNKFQTKFTSPEELNDYLNNFYYLKYLCFRVFSGLQDKNSKNNVTEFLNHKDFLKKFTLSNYIYLNNKVSVIIKKLQ
jgi:hypothetical protein